MSIAGAPGPNWWFKDVQACRLRKFTSHATFTWPGTFIMMPIVDMMMCDAPLNDTDERSFDDGP